MSRLEKPTQGPSSRIWTNFHSRLGTFAAKKYWDLSRPHGGHFPEGARIQYHAADVRAGAATNLDFEAENALAHHVVAEEAACEATLDRVVQALEILKGLGVEYVFFEDDSLFAKKRRAFQLFDLVKDMGLQLLDVNGINVCHLYRNNGHDLEVDQEFLDTLGAAGFQFLTLPFESASQRVLTSTPRQMECRSDGYEKVDQGLGGHHRASKTT